MGARAEWGGWGGATAHWPPTAAPLLLMNAVEGRGAEIHTDKFILSILQKKQFLDNMSEELLLENQRARARARSQGRCGCITMVTTLWNGRAPSQPAAPTSY